MKEPVDPDQLPEGTQVNCWRVVRPLGGGAYGSVYLVEHEGKLSALKLARFPKSSGDSRHTDERARRELNCLLSLEHPHIVQARFHGRWPDDERGYFYVVMDYVEGSTLAEWLERTHPTPHELVVLFDKVFSAVAYAHALGIHHRDLKPTNILVAARTGEPVVVDFGAASFPVPSRPALTDKRLPPGTPRYTSPEALRFEAANRTNPQARYEYTPADELYALGVTLFDLLTDPLHHSRPQLAPLMGMWDAPRAHEENPRVPLVLSAFVSRLLQDEPTKRPVSVEAARRELAELLPLQSEPWMRPVHPLVSNTAPSLQASPEPAPVELPPPPARRQSRGVAAGALVVALLVATGVALSLRGTTPAPPEVPAPVSGEVDGPAPWPNALAVEQPVPPSGPLPLATPPASPPEKGTPVNIHPSLPAVPTLCTQKQPPPRGTAQWLKWCKCTAIAGSLVATQAACPGAQLRQSVTEECSEESVQAMERLGMDLSGHVSLKVELDVKQPDSERGGCDREACIPEGPLTSRVANVWDDRIGRPGVESTGQLKRGTRLSGYAWPQGFAKYLGPRPLYRWTEATLPDGSKHPVCIEAEGNSPKTCPNGTVQTCAAVPAEIVKRWSIPVASTSH